MRRLMVVLALALLLAPGVGCAGGGGPAGSENGKGEAAVKLILTSPAFENGQPIPPRFTADGADVSPPLEISGIPEGTASLALIMDDPDAPMGTWVHWVVWNIPPGTRRIEEGRLPAGAVQGRNSWGRNAYGGPAPPSGTHRYYFKLYALDSDFDLPAVTDKAALLAAMEGHVLGQAQLMGTYRRR
jgi:Raf kinase inhibitor-like YbhB/YbcL family protein